ncbi:MAG: hypothetical protein GVY22_09260 [Gammaproteobacteria bacterium]|nr:hypothetical protein [Gammaproteobacteria bacterium]
MEELIVACHGASAANGWWDEPRNDGEMIALVHSELSEALEALRKPGGSEKIPGFTKLEEELADTIIRICDMAGARQLRLRQAIAEKLGHNQSRGHKHGGMKF